MAKNVNTAIRVFVPFAYRRNMTTDKTYDPYIFWMETWLVEENIDYPGTPETFEESTRAAIDKHYEGGCAAFEEIISLEDDEETPTCQSCGSVHHLEGNPECVGTP